MELRPNDIFPIRNRAHARHGMGEYDAAIKDFTSALKIDPRDPESLQYRGRCKNAKGESRIVKRGDFVGRHRVEEIKSDRVVLTATHQSPAGPVKVSHTIKVEVD